jgi:hypothetical protein
MSISKVKRQPVQEFLLTLFDESNGELNEIKEMNGFFIVKIWNPIYKHWDVHVYKNIETLKEASKKHLGVVK